MTAGRKVLVIDDEESIITYLQIILEDHGFVPLVALDGDAGTELARRERPDLICMDVMMPRRSGIALYQEFKRDPELASIPVMFISAFNQIRDLRNPETFRKMIPDPAIPHPEYCMEKPIKVGAFVEIVTALIEGREVK
ncbi:response regulator [Candidatus Bipolaricaulota bacterium]|nr:response regulator [Candidatus Bipolaricaulota bacterium]